MYHQAPIAWLASLWTTNKRTAIDIGAHIGHFTWILAQQFDHTLAFEPNQENATCLWNNINSRNHILRKGEITIYVQALYNEVKKYNNVNPTINNKNSGASMLEFNDNGEFETKTLDSYNVTDVDLIKIDCQGTDLQVIEGAKQTIEATHPLLLLETVNNGEYEQQLVEYIKKLDYEPMCQYGKQELYGWKHRNR